MADRSCFTVLSLASSAETRRRILQAFERRGLLDKDERKEMARWDHGGGFSGIM